MAGPGRPKLNFEIVAIEARKYYGAQGFWWVHWGGDYFTQRSRADHWQPLESFVHRTKNGEEVWNDLFLEFERNHPGKEDVDLRPPGNYPEFDRAFYGISESESEYEGDEDTWSPIVPIQELPLPPESE